MSKTKIFERKGSVLDIGGRTMKIPPNTLALAYLSCNKFVEGGEARDDGYVHYFGQPIKKWFGMAGNPDGESVRIWLPKIDSVIQLENLWRSAEEKRRRHVNAEWNNATSNLMKAKEAHAKISHKYEGDLPPWWLYDANRHGISFKWCKDEPKDPINLEIGQEYYDSERRLTQLTRRVNLIKNVLDVSLNKRLRLTKPNVEGELLKLIVNRRNYWFIATNVRDFLDVKLRWKRIQAPLTLQERVVEVS